MERWQALQQTWTSAGSWVGCRGVQVWQTVVPPPAGGRQPGTGAGSKQVGRLNRNEWFGGGSRRWAGADGGVSPALSKPGVPESMPNHPVICTCINARGLAPHVAPPLAMDRKGSWSQQASGAETRDIRSPRPSLPPPPPPPLLSSSHSVIPLLIISVKSIWCDTADQELRHHALDQTKEACAEGCTSP